MDSQTGTGMDRQTDFSTSLKTFVLQEYNKQISNRTSCVCETLMPAYSHFLKNVTLILDLDR